jgi:hypothetical protein
LKGFAVKRLGFEMKRQLQKGVPKQKQRLRTRKKQKQKQKQRQKLRESVNGMERKKEK